MNNLVLNGEPVGGFTADAVTRGRQLQLTARSNFPKATLNLDGNVELTGDLPGHVTMQFSNLDIDPFLRAEIRGRITGHSSMAGQATLSGPLKKPERLSGDFKIDAFKVEVEKVPIASDGPLEVRLTNGVASVQSCTLVSEDSRLAVSGSVSFKDARRLNLRADGNVNLKLVHTLDPEITSYGAVKIGITLTGEMQRPLVNGRIEVVHAGLSMIDLPTGLGDVNGAFVFSQDRLQVEHLTARVGGGLMTFGGFVTYGRTVGFDLTANGSRNPLAIRRHQRYLRSVSPFSRQPSEFDAEWRHYGHSLRADSVNRPGVSAGTGGTFIGGTQSEIAAQRFAPRCSHTLLA